MKKEWAGRRKVVAAAAELGLGFRLGVITGVRKGVLCVRQRCRRRRYQGGIWAVAGRDGVQHADSDAGWRLGRRDLD